MVGLHGMFGKPDVPGPDDTLGSGLFAKGDHCVALADVVVDLEGNVRDHLRGTGIGVVHGIRIGSCDHVNGTGRDELSALLHIFPDDDRLYVTGSQVYIIEDVRGLNGVGEVVLERIQTMGSRRARATPAGEALSGRIGRRVPAGLGVDVPVDGVAVNDRELIVSLAVHYVAVGRLGLVAGTGGSRKGVDLVQGEVLGFALAVTVERVAGIIPNEGLVLRRFINDFDGFVHGDSRQVGRRRPDAGRIRRLRLSIGVDGIGQPRRRSRDINLGVAAGRVGVGIFDDDIEQFMYGRIRNLGPIRLEALEGVGRGRAFLEDVRHGDDSASCIDFHEGIRPLVIAGHLGVRNDILLAGIEGVENAFTLERERLAGAVSEVELQRDIGDVDRQGEDGEIERHVRSDGRGLVEGYRNLLGCIFETYRTPARVDTVVGVVTVLHVEGEFTGQVGGGAAHLEGGDGGAAAGGLELELEGRRRRTERQLDGGRRALGVDGLLRDEIAVNHVCVIDLRAGGLLIDGLLVGNDTSHEGAVGADLQGCVAVGPVAGIAGHIGVHRIEDVVVVALVPGHRGLGRKVG